MPSGDDADGSVDLVIEGGTGGTVVAKNIAWKGGIGQQPELGLSAGGSVTLTSMNDAIGRSRWHLTLTIAYRRGAYRAAGVTYDAYDTLDLGAAMTCDLNLLNGKGFLETASGKTEVRTTLTARPVTEWKEDEEMPPPGCR